MLWRTFLVYLTCSPKPVWEILAPREPVDFEATFNAHFRGMTSEPVNVEQLLRSRAHLINWVAAQLDEPSKAFLRSVEAEQPDFELLGLPHARDLPGVQRKLHNLARRSESKREADHMQLEQALARVSGRTG